MRNSPKITALVVGAGPVGLTMAAELTRHGVRCRIIDRTAERTDKSKALVLWPRSLELLATAAAVEPFLRAGIRAVGARLHAEGRELARLNVTGVDSPYRFALMIPQSETERLLEAHLGRLGVTVERRVELMEFADDVEMEGMRAQLRVADGSSEEIRFDWLIGCDGAHSTVRHCLGIDFAGAAEPNDWILADVHIDGALPADELRLDLHADGILAFFPIGPQRFRVIADTGASALSERPADPTLAEVQAIVDRRGPGGLTLRDPIWLAGFRINERKVDHYRFGRVMLAGDAAHIHSPAGGQGMNTGMQDAFNLAWKLGLVVSGRGRADVLLDSYSSERSAVGDEVLRNAGAMTRLGTLRAPAAQRLRNHILPLLASLGVVQAKAGDILSELAIQYRDSPLSRDDRGLSLRARALAGGGVVAGDRAPDALLLDPLSGHPTSVFAMLRGTRHRLLLLGADAAALDAVAEEVRAAHPNLIDACIISKAPAETRTPLRLDPTGALAAHYTVHGATGVLVRPDGYVAYYGQPLRVEDLLEHLATYLR